MTDKKKDTPKPTPKPLIEQKGTRDGWSGARDTAKWIEKRSPDVRNSAPPTKKTDND